MSTNSALEQCLEEKIYQILLSAIPPHTIEFRPISYGTAGFRENAFDLKHIATRMGILVALRAHMEAACIGVMITASHNPPTDNGLKVIEPNGEMMDTSWESFANDLANSRNTRNLAETLTEHFSDAVADLKQVLTADEIAKSLAIKVVAPVDSDNEVIEKFAREVSDYAWSKTSSSPGRARVVIGFDNRTSSPDLVHRIITCLQQFGLQSTTFDHVTTPQLHYIVRCENNNLFGFYGEPSVNGYESKFASNFVGFTRSARKLGIPLIPKASWILVDGACGVGGYQMSKFMQVMRDCKDEMIVPRIHIVNPMDGKYLNISCGSDYVKTAMRLPRGVPARASLKHCCSLDGDGDRIVYWYSLDRQGIRVLDGDHVAVLICSFINEMATQRFKSPYNPFEGMKIGLVQTLYSNGASTEYAKQNLGMKVALAETGVKNLHREALKFDIGVYFEANGHGTILYGPAFKKQFAETKEKLIKSSSDSLPKDLEWFELFESFMELANITVGDAICDFLMVEAILLYRSWSIAEDWAEMYRDYPNSLEALKVPDKANFIVKGAECQLIAPALVAETIARNVKQHGCKAFVRPSGTENLIRLYVEAQNPKLVKEIVDDIVFAVKKSTEKEPFIYD